MIKPKEVIVLNILEFLLSKKILVVLSGLIFTGVAVASSGAESLFQENGLVSSETKIPEVQNITAAESSPSPQPSPTPIQQFLKKSSLNPSPKATTKPASLSPATISVTPKPTVTPKPSLRQMPLKTPLSF